MFGKVVSGFETLNTKGNTMSFRDAKNQVANVYVGRGNHDGASEVRKCRSWWELSNYVGLVGEALKNLIYRQCGFQS
jgi:hypothetical protein